MRLVMRAAGAYFAVVFAAGFAFGTLRVLALVPALGEVRAVLVELPAMLLVAYFAARSAVGCYLAAGAGAGPRLAMGALAFGFLLAAEMALAVWGFGQAPVAFLAALVKPAGMLGLAGQAGFALMPWFLWFGRRR